MSYPDITLLPTIAIFFNTTLDELFSFNTDTHNQILSDYQTKYNDFKQNGNLIECISLSRELLISYPKNYLILSNLADSLISCYEGLDAFHQIALDHHYLEESIKINELILSDCSDMNLKLKSTFLLCKYYPLVDQKDKALKLLENFSSLYSSKELLLENLLEGENCIRQQQANLLRLSDLAAQTLIHLSITKGKNIPHLSISEKINFILCSNSIYQLIISDENYLYFHSKLAKNHRRLAELYLLEKNFDNCFFHLNQAFFHAKCYDNLPDYAHYSSPFINLCEFDKNTYIDEGKECDRLYYMLTQQGVFDILNHDPRFIELIHKLI